MNWFKGLGISVKVAVVAFLGVMAVMAAKRQKAAAGKWQDTAVDIETKLVTAGTMTAAAASEKAKVHDDKAHEIKKKAVARIESIGGSDEEVADILDQFRKS